MNGLMKSGDVTPASATAAALVVAILGWLFLRYIPQRDEQMDRILATKDGQIEKLLAAIATKDAQIAELLRRLPGEAGPAEKRGPP
jgi:hypothetical protein